MKARSDYPSPEWQSRHLTELCRSRGVERAVADFIVHNLSRAAAEAALRAMPVIA